MKQKGRGLNWLTDIAHLSNAEKVGQKREGKILIFENFIPFEDGARMHNF
jgi:hypothetical protein